MSRIVLIGFMGSGKTTVARVLGERLLRPVIEMDERVLECSGEPSISAIFDRHGEAHFRELERRVAEELSSRSDVIISTGGGVVGNPATMQALAGGDAVVVFLRVQWDEMCARLQGDDTRPLLRDPEKGRRLYAQRLPLYRGCAALEIDTDGKPPDVVAAQIIEALERRK